MKISRLIACLTVLLMLSFSVQAQKNHTKEAEQAYSNLRYTEAIDLFKKAYSSAKKADEKAYINFMIGECYRKKIDNDQAMVYYERSVKMNYDKQNPEVFYFYGVVLQQEGDFAGAQEKYEKYLELSPGSQKGEDALKAIKLAQQWKSEEENTQIEIYREDQLNTQFYDFSPVFADRRQNVIFFTSSREEATGEETSPISGESFQDLFMTERDRKGKWSQPTLLPETINSADNEGAGVFDKKMATFYFTRCPSKKKENLGCDICKTTQTGNNWSQAEVMPLKPEGADSLTVGHPALTPDDRVMIFAGDLPGGQGGKDLWMIIYDRREDTWSAPQNLGPQINTPGDEMFPYIHNDGTLYFSSNGHLGMGGLDMFKAERVGDEDKWSNVENLKAPLNSTAHDYGIIFKGNDKKEGMFTSNREGGKGRDDIYSFKTKEIVFELLCVVKDKETGDPVPNAKIMLVGTDNSNIEVVTDENGEYSFGVDGNGNRYIKAETNYNIEVEANEYLKGKDVLSTVDLKESTRFVKEFIIQPANEDVVIDLPEVQYPYDKWSLLVNENVNSEDSLDFLYQTLIDNPTIIIELQAHTDCRGSDSYNKTLSQKRAEECVKYLISKGIPAERMQAAGMGEEVPRYPELACDLIEKMATEEEKEAAHQKNRRTQFRVLSFDYVPKEEGDDSGEQ